MVPPSCLSTCGGVLFPNQACLWVSYNNKRISVTGRREGGSPVMQGPVSPKILVPRSWYQDLGTRILVPAFWYQDLRRAREAEPLGMQEGTGGCRPTAKGVWGAGSPPGTAGGLGGGSPPVKTILWTQNHLPTTFNHLPTTFNHLLTTFNHLPTTFNHPQPTTFPLPFLRKR